jgi:Uma2 family endonuclease
MSVRIAKHWFTVAEYNRMGEAGIFSEEDRVELVEGEVIERSPIGKRHAACVKRLSALLHRRFGQTAIVSVQDPIQLNDFSEPQPDIVLLNPRDDFYEQSLPMPPDVLLLIEVAETTVQYDRLVKVPLYARASIPEVWLVNLPEEQIELYTEPISGAY